MKTLLKVPGLLINFYVRGQFSSPRHRVTVVITVRNTVDRFGNPGLTYICYLVNASIQIGRDGSRCPVRCVHGI